MISIVVKENYFVNTKMLYFYLIHISIYFLKGPNNSCIIVLPSLHKVFLFVYTYLHPNSLTSKCTYITKFQPKFVHRGVLKGPANEDVCRFY